MVSVDPDRRLTFDQYLSTYRGVAFPEIFYSFLHPFISSLDEASPSSSVTTTVPPSGSAPETLKTDSDSKIERVWGDWENIRRYLDEEERERYQGQKGEDRRPEAAETSKAGRGEVRYFSLIKAQRELT